MSDEIDSLVRRLESFERWLRINGYNDAPTVRQAADQLKRLTADNARLAAEVERLTPKPMTLQEACDVLVQHEYLGQNDWHITDLGDFATVGCRRFYSALHEETVMYIAQGLERDNDETSTSGGMYS